MAAGTTRSIAPLAALAVVVVGPVGLRQAVAGQVVYRQVVNRAAGWVVAVRVARWVQARVRAVAKQATTSQVVAPTASRGQERIIPCRRPQAEPLAKRLRRLARSHATCQTPHLRNEPIKTPWKLVPKATRNAIARKRWKLTHRP